MEFINKYTTAELSAINPITKKDKIIISNDAYAITEFIDALIKKIENVRVSLLTK